MNLNLCEMTVLFSAKRAPSIFPSLYLSSVSVVQAKKIVRDDEQELSVLFPAKQTLSIPPRNIFSTTS